MSWETHFTRKPTYFVRKEARYIRKVAHLEGKRIS